MTKPSLSIVFKGQTTSELDSKQNNWLNRRENPTHILKITDEHLPFEMSAPSIPYASIGSLDRFSRRIEYHE